MRTAGVLIPLSSLPSRHGIGDMGKYSYEFIDLLKQSQSRIWQILPLNPVGYGNSPYQPYSSFAGDEIYISIDKLYDEELLVEKPTEFNVNAIKVDFEEVREFKRKYLKAAYNKFKKNKYDETDKDYKKFIKQEWVYKYSVYLTLKKKNNLICWNEWPKEEKEWINNQQLSLDKYEERIEYEMFVQYLFYKQWMELKNYANDNGIMIMGDIPFYVGVDSLDVWDNQESFLLDKEGRPKFIAGVPPDYFSEFGQRWGNPIYNWEHIKKNDYKFWIERIAYNAKLFDIIRIDHFRAFDTYWSIPSSCRTAQVGEWLEAPGYEALGAIFNKLPDVKIVAEDLGDLRPEVLELRDHFKLPGMLIGQFNIDVDKLEPDYMGNENLIIYTGTHDNQTMMGWYQSQDSKMRQEIRKKLKRLGYRKGDISEQFMHYTLDSDANMAILPLQDILGIGDEGRINTPGTLGSPNWEWKLKDFKKTYRKMKVFKKIIEVSKR